MGPYDLRSKQANVQPPTNTLRFARGNHSRELAAQWFCNSCVGLLLLTALVKIFSASGEGRILALPDPLLTILSNRRTALLAAAFELLIVFLVLRAADVTHKAVLLGWIATVFLFYRASLWVIGYDGPCQCLGNLSDELHIAPTVAEWAARIILFYLLFGSALILWWRGLQSQSCAKS